MTNAPDLLHLAVIFFLLSAGSCLSLHLFLFSVFIQDQFFLHVTSSVFFLASSFSITLSFPDDSSFLSFFLSVHPTPVRCANFSTSRFNISAGFSFFFNLSIQSFSQAVSVLMSPFWHLSVATQLCHFSTSLQLAFFFLILL